MNMVQVYIKGQEDKELSSFLRYYPVRIKNIGMDAFFDRQVIYDFKDGRNHADVAKCVAKMLVKKFGRKVRSVVFSCVPASSQERNEARNKNFSELVCKFSGAINGFSHVKVVGERTAVHGTKVKKEERAKRLKENLALERRIFWEQSQTIWQKTAFQQQSCTSRHSSLILRRFLAIKQLAGRLRTPLTKSKMLQC